MKDTRSHFKSSALLLKNVRVLTILAMLGALSIILGYFSFQLGNFLKISFAFLPNNLSAYMFGPVAAPILGGTMDILNHLIKPTGPYFPGFTISAIVGGLIMGIGLYRKPLSLSRVAITVLINILLVNLLLNTIWLAMLYNQAFKVLLAIRIVKEIITWPIQTGLLYILLKGLFRAGVFSMVDSSLEKR